ncbi:MAG: exodeoxyribonuclease VII large subunit, partial [Oscillospiraceae bacterium]
LVDPDIKNLIQEIFSYRQEMSQQLDTIFREKTDLLNDVRHRLKNQSPQAVVDRSSEQVFLLKSQIHSRMEQISDTKTLAFSGIVGKLDALSPLKILIRGYSITFSEEQPISSIATVNTGDFIRTRVTDGFIQSVVDSVEKL